MFKKLKGIRMGYNRYIVKKYQDFFLSVYIINIVCQ